LSFCKNIFRISFHLIYRNMHKPLRQCAWIYRKFLIYATRVCYFFQEIYPSSANINSSPKICLRAHTSHANIKVLSLHDNFKLSRKFFFFLPSCHQNFRVCKTKFYWECEWMWQIKEDFGKRRRGLGLRGVKRLRTRKYFWIFLKIRKFWEKIKFFL
jgi:hypothetical protein